MSTENVEVTTKLVAGSVDGRRDSSMRPEQGSRGDRHGGEPPTRTEAGAVLVASAAPGRMRSVR